LSRLGAAVANVQLGVAVVRTSGKGVPAEGEDDVGGWRKAVLEDAGTVEGAGVADVDGFVGQTVLGADEVADGEARKEGRAEQVDTGLLRGKGLVVGGVSFLADKAEGLCPVDVRREIESVGEGGDVSSGVEVLVEAVGFRVSVRSRGGVVLIEVLGGDDVVFGGVPVEVGNGLIAVEGGPAEEGDVGLVD
jgi:hypothetical protein